MLFKKKNKVLFYTKREKREKKEKIETRPKIFVILDLVSFFFVSNRKNYFSFSFFLFPKRIVGVLIRNQNATESVNHSIKGIVANLPFTARK